MLALFALTSMAPAAHAGVVINSTNFPDAELRRWVTDDIDGCVDGNKDGQLSDDEIAAVTYVDFSGWGISSFKGIGHFTAITEFRLESSNMVTTLDLTGLNALTNIYITECSKLASITWPEEKSHLTSIDLSGDTALHGFDFKPFANLQELNITGCTSWGKTLDISGLKAIHYLYFQGSSVENLIARDGACNNEWWSYSGLEQVKDLDVSNSTVDVLDFGAWSGLQEVTINNCTGLRTLILQNLAELTSVDLTGSSDLEFTELTNNPKLASITWPEEKSHLATIRLYSDTALPGFSFKPFTNLQELNITGCTSWGKTLDISGLRPRYIYFADTGIETFIAKNNALWNWWVWTGQEQVKHLDISNDLGDEKSKDNIVENISGELNSWTALETLDITNNVELRQLDVACENLKSIKMDNCPNLADLRIGYTQVPEFDVAAVLPNLERLYLDRQAERSKADYAWKKLDTSRLPHLKELNIYNNQLSYLNLGSNKEMTYQFGLWEQYPDFQLVKLSKDEVGIALPDDFNGAKVEQLQTNDQELTPKTVRVDGQQYFVVWNDAATAESLINKTVWYAYQTDYLPTGGEQLQVTGTATSVIKCPSFLKLSAQTLTGVYGATATAPTITRSEGYDGKLTFATSDPKVVTVDANGLLTIVGAGNATVTITGAETDYRQAPAAVSYEVVIEKASPELAFEKSAIEALVLDPVPANALTKGVYDGTVTYKSSDENVATVDADGKVTTKTGGTVTITANGAETANCHAAKQAVYTLTVKKRQAEITLMAETIKGTYGQEEALTAPKPTVTEGYNGKLAYASDNEGVVKVDAATGSLTIAGAGKATITVSAPETATHYAATSKSYNVSIDKGQPQMAFGHEQMSGFDGDVLPANTLSTGFYDGKVSYASSNTGIATVDADGQVTLLAPGSATITARGEETANCLATEASYEVTVKLRGDVNSDNTVDVADIASIISVMAGANEEMRAAADVNGDRVVDVADIANTISIMAARARRLAGLKD